MPFITPDDSDITTDMLESALILTTMGHALTDFLRSDEEMLAAFYRFIGAGNDEEIANVRENVDRTHDAFERLANRAQSQLFLSQILSGFPGESADGEGISISELLDGLSPSEDDSSEDTDQENSS